jgi:hypothetical protein
MLRFVSEHARDQALEVLEPSSPKFESTTGFLPTGRVSLSWDEAEAMLVAAFPHSATRGSLWAGLERYTAEFAKVEDRFGDKGYEELRGMTLLKAFWLGGSFVSAKQNPKNIDLTVIYDKSARDLLKSRPGSGWMVQAFQRDRCRAEYGVSPLPMGYRPIASVFQHGTLPPADQTYLRERGAWDDWWQRCRTPGVDDEQPSIETAAAVRGYVEVVL